MTQLTLVAAPEVQPWERNDRLGVATELHGPWLPRALTPAERTWFDSKRYGWKGKRRQPRWTLWELHRMCEAWAAKDLEQHVYRLQGLTKYGEPDKRRRGYRMANPVDEAA